MRGQMLALLVLCLCTTAACTQSDIEDGDDGNSTAPTPAGPRVRPHPAKVCVVIRTYWGHGLKSKQGLQQLLNSLARQHHNKCAHHVSHTPPWHPQPHSWEAVVIVMDTKPFDDLYTIVQQYGDHVWVYAELVRDVYIVGAHTHTSMAQIGGEYSSRNYDGAWSDVYHGSLYNLTDQAIRVCSRDTEWLVVTNGDNEYAPSLFSHLDAAADDVDLVAFDYYSRYQRSTGPPCHRFAMEQDGPACKRNLLKWCHTDLGANVFSYPRFVGEDRRFGAFKDGNHTADHFDGLMLESLVEAGWQYLQLGGHCLYDHSPSPQRCARLGGVWDDTVAAEMLGAGGRCITREAAHTKTQQHREAFEVVSLPLSSDGNLSAWQPDHPEHILCIRYREHQAQHLNFMYFYGPACVDAADKEAFDWDRWNEYQAELARQEAAAYEKYLEQVEAAKRGELVPAPLAAVTRVQWQAIPKPPPKRRDGKHTPKFRARWRGAATAKPTSKPAPAREDGEL